MGHLAEAKSEDAEAVSWDRISETTACGRLPNSSTTA
jgi:hypothetical protein